MNAIGAHIYAGGFTLGVQKYFNVLCHLEESDFGIETVQKNLKLPVFRDDKKLFTKGLKIFAVPAWVVMKKQGKHWNVVAHKTGSELSDINAAITKDSLQMPFFSIIT